MQKRETVVKTFVVNQMGGTKVRLVSEKDIIDYLRSLKRCPCCGESHFKGESFYNNYDLACKDCGFKLMSLNLYHGVEIKKGNEVVIISKVLEPLIRERIKEYRKTLRNRMTGLINLKLVPLTKKLELIQAQEEKESAST